MDTLVLHLEVNGDLHAPSATVTPQEVLPQVSPHVTVIDVGQMSPAVPADATCQANSQESSTDVLDARSSEA
ncbi:hypothetical protein V6N13_089402 [Hibiscus sabdariffa]